VPMGPVRAPMAATHMVHKVPWYAYPGYAYG
jgi:hypothetical protein